MPGHVALLLPDLRPGGTERLTLDLAEGFLARGISVDLVLCQQQGDFLSQVPEGARVIDLAAPRLRSVFGPLRRYLRQEQPQALIAAMWPLTSIAVWAAMGLSTRPRVVVSDHCPLSMQYAQRLGRVKLSMRASYRFAQGVVGVSQGLTSELAELAGIAPSRVTTIYNPVPRPALSGSDPDGLWLGRKGKRIVSVGSAGLDRRSGFCSATSVRTWRTTARSDERGKHCHEQRKHELPHRFLLPGEIFGWRGV